MMNLQSSQIIEQKMSRGDQLQLVKTFSRFLKLRKSGFPFSDARFMTGLQDDEQFVKAQDIYRSFL